MNTLIQILLTLLLTGLTPIFAQNDNQQLIVPLSDPSKPGTLEVGLVNGFIHVVGHTGKDVIIDVSSFEGRQRARNDDQNASGMRRISPNNGLDVTAEERNNRVKIDASSHVRPVNLTIKVPQRFGLKLSTVNNGDITVENVTGELEINNVNGPIELNNVGGSAVANTINGNLKATFRDLSANAPMAFSTLNGRVDVTFPANAKANIKLKSDRGEVYSDFDINIDKSQPKTTKSNQTGMYRVSIEDWIYGKINGGGPEVMMKSMQGNIYVRKAK
ncbi:DUF4097 family beta strand repeat-containing protein [Nibrella saemangeumensis]|uniref:DUF4097 family beta strand repeat-containing protein n=1 Tax=Nibrella saemangeumensis TaxID=1084526 RepID=A0ABP8MZN2_9BACT